MLGDIRKKQVRVEHDMYHMDQIDEFHGDVRELVEVSPSLAESVIETVRSLRNEKYKISSRSTVIDEAVKTASKEYTDGFDIGESAVDELLDQQQNNLGNATEAVKKNSPDIPDLDSPKKQITLTLPKSLVDQLPDRNFGAIIEECIVEYTQSAYHHRTDRMRAKKDLLEYLRSDKTPEHRVIKDLVENKSESTMYQFGSLLTIFNETNYWSSYDSVSAIILSDEWESIKTGSPRIEAMEEYYQRVATEAQNSSTGGRELLPTTFEDVYQDIGTAYSPSRPTKRDHARQMDLVEIIPLVKEHALTSSDRNELQEIKNTVLVDKEQYELYEPQNKNHVLVSKTDIVDFIFQKGSANLVVEEKTVNRKRTDGTAVQATKYVVKQT